MKQIIPHIAHGLPDVIPEVLSKLVKSLASKNNTIYKSSNEIFDILLDNVGKSTHRICPSCSVTGHLGISLKDGQTPTSITKLSSVHIQNVLSLESTFTQLALRIH